MYLVDTNVWLERLLDQDKSDEVGEFFNHVLPGEVYITDFNRHSIGIILTRLERAEVFHDFVDDLFGYAGANLVSLIPFEMRELPEIMANFRLDFDDAYQYLAARNNSLTLVSFDADFDRTDRSRLTPREVLGKRPPAVQ